MAFEIRIKIIYVCIKRLACISRIVLNNYPSNANVDAVNYLELSGIFVYLSVQALRVVPLAITGDLLPFPPELAPLCELSLSFPFFPLSSRRSRRDE